MLFANLFLRAPIVVIFATVTRLLWSTTLETADNPIHSYVASGHDVATNSSVKTNASVQPKSKPSTVAAADQNNTDQSFRLNNLDLSIPISCGKKKCLFTLKSDPSIGYLVLSSDGDESKLKKLTVAWLYAKHLEFHYKSKHLFLGEPKELKISSDFAQRLNTANLTRLAVNGVVSSQAPSFSKGVVLAQKVHVSPKSSLLVGCDRKFDHAMERLDEFVSAVEDKKKFVVTFEEQVAVMKNVLKVKENQCLLRDFQVLVDTKGNINQIDLDRCPLGGKYKEGFKDHVKKCTGQFDEFVNRCKKAVLAS